MTIPPQYFLLLVRFSTVILRCSSSALSFVFWELKAEISPGFLSDIENGKKWGSFETLIAIANALEVEPYELLLPPQTSISYDTKRTKDLMNRLRKNLGEVVDTLEDFLGEK